MYIRKIHITNIRGLEAVDLDLDRGDAQFAGWTVIAGRNGSGKSTLLKAIALAVAGPKRVASLHSDFAGWIRSGEKTGRVDVTLHRGTMDGGDQKLGSIVDVSLQWVTEELVASDIPDNLRTVCNPPQPHMNSTCLIEGHEDVSNQGIWSEADIHRTRVHRGHPRPSRNPQLGMSSP